MVTDAVPDRVLKSGHQPFHTPDLFLVPLDGEMLLKEGDVGIIPRQADPDGSVFQIGIFQKPVRAVLVAVGPDGMISARISAEAVVTTALDALSRR